MSTEHTTHTPGVFHDEDKTSVFVTCQACKVKYEDLTNGNGQGDGCTAWLVRCEFGVETDVGWNMDWRQLDCLEFHFAYSDEDKVKMDEKWKEFKDQCARTRERYKDRIVYSVNASYGSQFDSESKAMAFVDEDGMRKTGWDTVINNAENNNVLCDTCIWNAFASGHIQCGGLEYSGEQDLSRQFELCQPMTSQELQKCKPRCLK